MKLSKQTNPNNLSLGPQRPVKSIVLYITRGLIITGICTALLLTVLTFTLVGISQPKRSGVLKITGLHDKVNISFDKHGRAHVFANNIHDLVFTQGYLTAQDRLFQLDILRRVAKGELAEIIGKYGLTRDTFVRDIGLMKSAEEELKNIDGETLTLLNYYSEGITTFIKKNKRKLPLEFKVLNYVPKPWQPIDSVIIVKELAEIIDTSWQLDLIRQEIYQTLGEKANVLFEQSFPGNPTINSDVKQYLVFDDLALKKPSLSQRWQKIKGKVVLKKILATPYFKIKKTIIEAADFLRNGSDRWEGLNWGSNCWVLSTTKYETPILANDPHLELANPSFWYPIHLVDKTNNINTLGLSIPGLPGILIGHNEKIAWGITSLSADVQDVFIGEFKNNTSNLYKDGNTWKRAKIIKSKIKVKNEKEPYIHKSVFTSFGPVLDRDEKQALIVKWSTIEATDHNSVKSIWKLSLAKNWKEFREALKDYGGPTLSFHYVDIDGNIGYQASGVIPHRVQGTGSLPISGFNSDKHWLGYIPFEKLPNAYNPEVGYIVSANNKVISSDYEYDLGNNFLSPFRAVRISTLLSQNQNLNLQKNKSIQKDIYSWVANYLTIQILEAYYNSQITNKDLLPVIHRLSKWDFNLSAESPEALIFERTYENLFKKILINKLGVKLSKDYLKEWRAGSLALLKILIDEDAYWLPNGIKNYESLLLLSLSDAIEEIKTITKSSNIDDWKWGKYHTLTFDHPFSKAVPFLSPLTNTGPISLGGDRDTVSAFGTNANLKVSWGPSARVVIDLKDFNSAHVQLPLGTSAELGSPYYRDQTKGWIKNNDEPFVYDEELVISKAKDKLVLKP